MIKAVIVDLMVPATLIIVVILELIHASKPDFAEGLCLVAQNLLCICMPSCKFDRGNLCVVRHVGNCRFVTAVAHCRFVTARVNPV